MQTGAQVQAHVLQKAEADPEFRERLIADPKSVIEAETGLELPDDAFVFVEQAIATAQKAVPSVDAPLTEDELIQVMGGVMDCSDPETRANNWVVCHGAA